MSCEKLLAGNLLSRRMHINRMFVALMQACKEEDSGKKGAVSDLINMPEPDLSVTALMIAAQSGNLEFVEILVGKGAELDQVINSVCSGRGRRMRY